MLSHLHRFHGHGSLRYVYRHGRRGRGDGLSVSYSKNPQRVHSRFAVVVSKKIFKSAVRRNRLRRRLDEIIRLELARSKAPYDVVITVAAPELLTAPPPKLKQQLLELLEKEQLIG